MRGIALSVLRSRVKYECGDTQEANDFADNEINSLLYTEQQDQANANDWEFLRRRWDLSFAAGVRYATLPTADDRGLTSTINWERPVQVTRLWNRYYNPVHYGIGPAEFNYLNSDRGQQQDPIQKWQWSTNTLEPSTPNDNQIEVWPLPVSTQTVRFEGQRIVQALAVDTDVADLDDLLLVFFVAAKRLALRGSPQANIVQAKAQQHLIRLRAAYNTDDEPIVLGRENLEAGLRRRRRLIPVAIASSS